MPAQVVPQGAGRWIAQAALWTALFVLPNAAPILARPHAQDVPALPQELNEVVYATRAYGPDVHYYANFGYYSDDPNKKVYPQNGGALWRLNLHTGTRVALLRDDEGGFRDAQVHYDAQKVLFSYRRGRTDHYHLYEINLDGSGLRQLTDGPYDDIEPTYLPDGGIAFCSSRCHRWVMCWSTPVAILYRCDADGGNIRPLSSNAVTENTPAVLFDGRLLYTRWEYVDRSQLAYHHLWTMNPDGTSVMTFFGNMHPTGKHYQLAHRQGNVVSYDNVPGDVAMLDARPVPGSRKVVAIFSPGHGRAEHEGYVTLIDPQSGPDHLPAARRIHPDGNWRDPWPVSPNTLLVARGRELHLMNDQGQTRLLHRLQDEPPELKLHEPVPVVRRNREPRLTDRTDPAAASGTLILSDITHGRNMEGVAPGEIKRLLVLEQLPGPFHNSPGFDGISLWGTFTLTRILGTVPVEADGSACFNAPALRSLFFVALDEHDLSVKRMQSFLTLQPGETISCVGCHEPRTSAPPLPRRSRLLALNLSFLDVQWDGLRHDVSPFPFEFRRCCRTIAVAPEHGGGRPSPRIDAIWSRGRPPQIRSKRDQFPLLGRQPAECGLRLAGVHAHPGVRLEPGGCSSASCSSRQRRRPIDRSRLRARFRTAR
jgi:hypothetical protein